MADNVAVTAGSGVNIAADDVSSVYYQKVKLDAGGDGVSVPLIAGSQADAASLPVALSTEDVALLGALTETAPGTDTASSGLNGRLQRIAQRLSTLITALGTMVFGGGTEAAALRVTVASDSTGVLTVDGTVTAELSATDNAVLDSIDTDLTTIIGHVDGIEALLGTIDADTGGILTSVQLIDDAIFAEDVAAQAADKGVAILAVRRDADTSLVGTDNDYAQLQVNANGALKVEVFSGETLPVSGTVTAELSATDNAVLDSIDTDLTTIIGHVDGIETLLGTIDADTGNIATAVQIMDDWDNAASDGASVSGDVAHDAADAGEPLKIGGKAVSAEPTAVSANDRVNALFDLVGKLITMPYTIPENIVSGAITTAMTGTTSTSLVAAPGAGLRNYITTIIVSNAHASVGTDIIIQDGSGGTTLMTIPAAAVYGGAVINLPVPLRQPTTNTALFCANVTTGASTKVSAVGYKGA